MVLETHIKLCVAKPVFWETFFWPQYWEKEPKTGQQNSFFNLLENLVINFY